MFKTIVLLAVVAVTVAVAKPQALQYSNNLGLGYAGVIGDEIGLGYPGVYENNLGLGIGSVYGNNLGLYSGIRNGLGRSLGLGVGPYNNGIYAGHQPYSYSNIIRPLHAHHGIGHNGLGRIGLNPLGYENGLIL